MLLIQFFSYIPETVAELFERIQIKKTAPYLLPFLFYERKKRNEKTIYTVIIAVEYENGVKLCEVFMNSHRIGTMM